MPLLYMLSGPKAGDSFEIKDGTNLVGRGPDNDLQILEQSISRKHARILLSGDRLFIEDLGSQNGTQINGHPVGSYFQIEIKEGDFIVHVPFDAFDPTVELIQAAARDEAAGTGQEVSAIL